MVRGDRRSEFKRREILNAARALFVTEGYADTGMEVVARHAAVSTATLYAHFQSKAELFRATVAELIHEIAEAIARDAQPEAGARVRLSAFARSYAAFCANPMAVRAHSCVAPASPQAGAMPMRSRNTERANPSRSVTAAAAFATSSNDGCAPGATAGTVPSTTVRPLSTNSPIPSRSAALNVATSTDSA